MTRPTPKLYTYIVALLLIPFAPHVAAQDTGTIAGSVTDGESNRPIVGANVMVPALDRGAATADEGRFRISNVPTGEHTLVVRFVGYRTKRRTVTVQAGETVRIRISLGRRTVQADGIQVTALRPGREPSTQIESEQIREAEVADPGALLRDMPGVSSVRRGPVGLDPNVRGLQTAEVGVYVNGMRTFPAGPARMDSPMSHIDPSTISDIKVVKGPYALTWGPGNMSAIRVEQRGEDPPRTPLTGSIRTGFDSNRQGIETTGFVMGRQGKWFYSANGAWRTGDDYESGSGQNVPGDFRSADARGRIGVEVTDHSTLSFSGSYQDQNDIDYPGRLLNATFFETGMGQLKYEYQNGTGSLRSLTARASAQQTLHEMDNRGKPTFESGRDDDGNIVRPPLRIGVESEIQNFSGRVAADLAFGPGTDVTVGGDVLHTFRDAERPLRAAPPGREPFIPPFYQTTDGEILDEAWPGVTITQGGAFVQASRALGDALTLTGTTRLDLIKSDANSPTGPFLDNAVPGDARITEADLEQDDVTLSGALTASLSLTDRWTLSLGGGSVARAPTALERYSDRFPATKAQTSAEFQGTPSLDPERSTQGDLWIEGTGTNWSISASGFVRHIDDYITLTPASDIDPILPLSPETVFRYTNGEANFFGSEVSAVVSPVEPLTLRASGNWLWGKDQTLDEPAFGVSPPSGTLGMRWSPSIALRRVSDLYLDGTVRFVAEQDRAARSRNETPTDGYTTVDLRAGARIVRRVRLKIGVKNLFDSTYTNHLNAKNPFSAARVPEPGRVVTTTLSVQF